MVGSRAVGHRCLLPSLFLPPQTVLRPGDFWNNANASRWFSNQPEPRPIGLSERYLEPVLQALARHDIVKGTRGPRGGYQLAREERRITADDIFRAAGTAAEMDCTPAIPRCSRTWCCRC